MTRRAVDPARLARAAWLAAFLAAAPVASAQTDAGAAYDAPAGFYDASAGLTGTALQEALRLRMTTNHVVTSYSAAAEYLAITDADPANNRFMFNVYDRGRPIDKGNATNQGFVGLYASREHVWPDSRQTGSANGDIHMLKPSDAPGGLNELRGNLFYGGGNLSGAARKVTETNPDTFFAGDADLGDVARVTMYGATRWSGDGLRLVDGNDGTGNQMGDKQTILRWHYRDAPDLFERRRNDVIYRGDDIRTTGDDFTSAQGAWDGSKNRNAFVDRPEYAWSVFQNQNNDTRLKLGATAAAVDGSSTATVNLGRVLRDAIVPAAQTLTLNKTGLAGTYYSVTAAGDATSSVGGRLNAFAMDANGTRQITVGLNTSTAAAGLKSGTVTIDNLDVTTGMGAGYGAGDANDVASVQLSVLDASNSSFSADRDADALTIDFGSVREGSAESRPFSIFNFASSLGTALTAGLDFTGAGSSGVDDAKFDTTLATFEALAAGSSRAFEATIDTSEVGSFYATYSLYFRDEDLPGTRAENYLVLALRGTVTAVPEPTTMAFVGLLTVSFTRRRRV